jgi:hypothetical protein
MFGEMTSMVVAVVLGAVAALLRGLAERIEAYDDGEPVRLAIGDGKEKWGDPLSITSKCPE